MGLGMSDLYQIATDPSVITAALLWLQLHPRLVRHSFKLELLQHLGLSVSQISPNAWRVFIAMEVLYGAMSRGSRLLTV